MNIQEIRTQLEELTTKVNELEQQPTSGYTFTEEQMISFVKKLHEEFIEGVNTNIRNCSFDADDIVELDFDSYSRSIEVSIDSKHIVDEVIDAVDDFSWEDEDVKVTVDNIYRELSK